ncbi:hypothetical protein [Aeromonas jandaei]
MSLSASQINSQITAENFIKSTNDESFTLTLNHDGINKAYTIKTDANNRVVSATRIEPGTSTWDKLKTALANFFGTSNNARIVKEMNKMPQEKTKELICESINNKKKLLKETLHKGLDKIDIDHKDALLKTIKNPIIKFISLINKPEYNPLDKDKNEAVIMYKMMSECNQWKDMVPTFLATENSAAQVGMIQYGDKEFLRELIINGSYGFDDGKINKALLNASPQDLSKLATLINDTMPDKKTTKLTDEQNNLSSFLGKLSTASKDMLVNAGASYFKVFDAY